MPWQGAAFTTSCLGRIARSPSRVRDPRIEPAAMPDGPQVFASSSIERVLAGSGLLSGAALERARRLEAESGERIDRIAAKLGLVSERDLAAAYAELIGSPILDPADFPGEPVAPDRIRRAFLEEAPGTPIADSEAPPAV